MTNEDIYNLVKKNGMATHAACSLLAQTFQQMANLFAVVESDQPAEPATSTFPTEVRPPEMANHAPSTMPPEPRKWEHHYPGIVDGKFVRTSDCAYGCGERMGGNAD